jgi:hypothetical protein
MNIAFLMILCTELENYVIPNKNLIQNIRRVPLASLNKSKQNFNKTTKS